MRKKLKKAIKALVSSRSMFVFFFGRGCGTAVNPAGAASPGPGAQPAFGTRREGWDHIFCVSLLYFSLSWFNRFFIYYCTTKDGRSGLFSRQRNITAVA